MSTNTPKTRLTPAEISELTGRVMAIREQLPTDYLNWMVVYNPDWKQPGKFQRLKDVKAGRAHDEEMTAAMEHCATIYQEALQKMVHLGEMAREEAEV